MTDKKITRNIEFCAAADIDPILNLLRNDCNVEPRDAFRLIGFSDSMLSAVRRDEKVRVSTKYALLGLYHELGGKAAAKSKATFELKYDEAASLFAALDQQTRVTPHRREELRQVMARVALHMVQQTT